MKRIAKLIATAAILCVPIVSYAQFNQIDRNLQGQFAGVSVINSSSTYGNSPLITVRGSSSLLGTSSPLWVVDGVPMQSMTQMSLEQMAIGYPVSVLASDVTGLPEEDIASIEVLTDAASAVLYGERGANGVILVTTRNGKNQRVEMTVSGEIGNAQPTWRDDIYDSSLCTKYHVDLSGGFKKSAMYGALTGINQESGLPRDKVNDFNARLNLSYTLWDDLSIELFTEESKRSQKAPYLQEVFDDNTTSEDARNRYLDADVENTKVQLRLAYKPLDILSFKLVSAGQLSKADMALYMTMEDGVYPAKNDIYTDLGNGMYKIKPVCYEILSLYMSPTLTYTPVKNKTHLLNIYAGAEIKKVDRELTNTKKSNRDNSLSYFVNTQYTYKNLYSIGGIYRWDKYTKDDGVKLDSWSLAGDWNMREASFFKPLRGFFSKAQMRVSYAKMAIRDPDFVVAPYKADGSVYGVSYYMPITVQLLSSPLGNGSDLTHERLREWNIGLDMAWMHNRIQLSVDWYSRRHDNLVNIITLQGVGGEIRKFMNMSNIKSHGVEATLRTKNLDSKEWTWNTQLTCSYHYEKDDVTYGEDRSRFISPSIYGGLNNQLHYKNWSLGMMMSYAFDYDVLTDGFTQVSGSHIRLKDLMVGYHLPEQTVQRLHLNDVAFHLTGSNLCLLYSDSDLGDQDPEFMNIGGVRTPMMRQLRFGVAVKF